MVSPEKEGFQNLLWVTIKGKGFHSINFCCCRGIQAVQNELNELHLHLLFNLLRASKPKSRWAGTQEK